MSAAPPLSVSIYRLTFFKKSNTNVFTIKPYQLGIYKRFRKSAPGVVFDHEILRMTLMFFTQ